MDRSLACVECPESLCQVNACRFEPPRSQYPHNKDFPLFRVLLMNPFPNRQFCSKVRLFVAVRGCQAFWGLVGCELFCSGFAPVRVLLRFCSGFAPVLLRFCSGFAPVLLRFYSGFTPVLLRFPAGAPVLLRFYSGFSEVPTLHLGKLTNVLALRLRGHHFCWKQKNQRTLAQLSFL